MKYLFGTKEENPRWSGGKPKCVDCGQQLKDYNSKRESYIFNGKMYTERRVN